MSRRAKLVALAIVSVVLLAADVAIIDYLDKHELGIGPAILGIVLGAVILWAITAHDVAVFE